MPDDSTIFIDEATTAQFYIDILQAQGVNKIILLTHYQYQNDVALAQQLRGVDVIVGGDSHSLLGEHLAELGLSPEGPYPTQVLNADGHRVCVVQAWENALAMGELNVSFDAQGRVLSCGGQPRLPLTEGFKRRNADGQWQPVSAEVERQILAEVAANPSLVMVSEDTATTALLQVFTEQLPC